MIGSAAGDGADTHVDMFIDIINEIIIMNSYRSMNVISNYSEMTKDTVHEKLRKKAITPCGTAIPNCSRKISIHPLVLWLK